MAESFFRDMNTLDQQISLTPEERGWFSRNAPPIPSPPCAVPAHYLSLIKDPDDPNDPVRRQCIPTDREYTALPQELEDPLGEDSCSASRRLLHRYPDRALFLTTDQCWMYCRHCFRRRFTARGHQRATVNEIKVAADYLNMHPEVRELLVSGGDPLTADDAYLDQMLRIFRGVRPSLVIRICTRAPVVYPSRITEKLCGMLGKYHPLYVVTQFNHPHECSESSMSVTSELIDRGIPVCNQSVLLRGINDHEQILGELFRLLTAARITPYYLFQGDLARGTSHFRVPLQKGIALVRKLTHEISGLSMPTFAVDLPGGGGKIRLLEQQPEVKTPGKWGYRSRTGILYWYPLEP